MPQEPKDGTSNTPENWRHILLNGRTKQLSVLNPVFVNGELVSIDNLIPFDRKDENGQPIKPTLNDAKMIQRRIYGEFFKKAFKNLLILSGAGSSMDVGGLSMAQLWRKVESKYTEEVFKELREKVNFTSEKLDLEALLSQIDGYIKFGNQKQIELGQVRHNLSDIRDTIFEVIKTSCTISRPEGNYAHKIFLEKLLQRKQTNPRIKIYTLNYDLLFEYAATDVNAIVIDGFSFTFPRTFSGRFFDYDIVQREGSKLQEEDNFIQRVFHLHKLHGSLNWEREEGKGQIIVNENPAKPLMVYPREAKYEDSYEQPFFEMMARFQRSLRINNDTLLICIGYSFNDKHINAAIEEALNQNPSFRLAIVDPRFDIDDSSASLKAILEIAGSSERVIMISEKFLDFASHFPEIKTYDTDNIVTVNLKNDGPAKD